MRKTYIVVISIIVLLTIITLNTYAMFTQDINIGEFVNLTASTLPTESNIIEYERITIPAGVSRTIDLNITNSSGNSLYYGVWYEMINPETINEDIHIGKLTGSSNPTIGQLASNGNTTVQIAIVNNSSDDIIINVGVGYSNTNSLNLPTNRSVISGEAQPSVNAAEKIMSLSQGNSWNSGASGVYETNNHEYRYVGANVNNYVRFNDDMYRIIGVFDSNSHGIEGQYLVKLIVSRSIASYTWGTTNSAPAYTTYSDYNNNWETANANILLNEYFLNATDTSTTYSSCSNWTYYYSYYNGDHKLVYKTYDCSDIIGYGIQTTSLRNYIQPVTWFLKGRTSASSKQNFYTCERSNATTISGCGKGTGGLTKLQDKYIGLMYASDYLYASGYYASTDTANSSQYEYGQQNWLYKGYEWTITPNPSQFITAFKVYYGSLTSDTTGEPYAIRPSFYLKSTVKIKSGVGTIYNPYVIAYN